MFCKIFDSEKFGQILVQIDSNDEGEDVIAFTVDTHPEDLSPTKVSLAMRKGVDVRVKFSQITQEEAETMAKEIHKQVEDLLG